MLENGQYKGAITVNKHEKIILEKLTEDPMLSQTELARMLNITRSSVSVYISYLMQKGYIRGRGYVIEDQKNVCVIGSSGVDYQTVMAENQIFTPLALDDYDLRVSYGGICKNIAESLTRFGLRTSCISAVGSDLLGQSLIEECKSAGVDTDNFMIVPSERTSTYLEIRTLDFNKIILASANMKLQRLITPEFLSSKQYKLRHAQLIVVEDSLSSETLKYVSSTYSPTLFVCTKPTRIKRYKDFLNQFNGMVTSLENAAAILGRETPDASDEKSVFRISQQLHAQLAGPCWSVTGTAIFVIPTTRPASSVFFPIRRPARLFFPITVTRWPPVLSALSSTTTIRPHCSRPCRLVERLPHNPLLSAARGCAANWWKKWSARKSSTFPISELVGCSFLQY